tara:strand:- start:3234 stop:3464 length:231 start_codon:yes stop_codon:yes gene_type:complete
MAWVKKTIDAEPDWNNIIDRVSDLDFYIEWIQTGTPYQKELAIAEIRKLANACSMMRKKQKKYEAQGKVWPILEEE